jgi:hypothetical protein
MSKITIRATDLQLRGARKVHTKSTFLGYADATLLISAGSVEIFSLRIRNMTLVEFASGLHIDFPSETIAEVDPNTGRGRKIPHCFTNTAISRKRITSAMAVAYKMHMKEISKAA